MKLIKLIIIILIICQVFSHGKAMPALAAGFNAISPVITHTWQKQTLVNKDVVARLRAGQARFIGQTKTRMIASMLPKIKRAVNIDKIAEDLARLKKKVDSNV